MQKILYIEDDELVVSIVKNILQRNGFEVISAETAGKGLKLAAEERPTLILMDMWLPSGMDGWEATELLKNDTELADIPVIAITAQSGYDARVRALEAGCAAYITKPFEIHDLVKCIKDVLGTSSAIA